MIKKQRTFILDNPIIGSETKTAKKSSLADGKVWSNSSIDFGRVDPEGVDR